MSQEFSTVCAFSTGASFNQEDWNFRRAELAAEVKGNREHGEEANRFLNDLLSEGEKEEKKKWIVYEVPQLTEESKVKLIFLRQKPGWKKKIKQYG